MTEERSFHYVVDNTVLSNFARIRRTDLLQLALASGGATTPAVRRELENGEALGIVPRLDWHWLPTIELSAEEKRLSLLLQAHIDIGEAECLAIAISRSVTIVTDDRAARKQANKRGIPMSGTLGVLKKLVDDGKVLESQADTYLANMIAEGYHSPVTRLSQIRR